MRERAGFGPSVDGVRALRGPYELVRASPDGRWLACWRPLLDASDPCAPLDVLDLATGESVWSLANTETVDSVVWAAPDVLLVLRGVELRAHELPDGGVIASAMLPGFGHRALQVSRDRRRVYVDVTRTGRARGVVLSLPALEIVVERALDEDIPRAIAERWRGQVNGVKGVMDPEGTRVAYAVAASESDVRLVVFDARSGTAWDAGGLVAQGLPPLPEQHLRWLSRDALLAAPGVESNAHPALVTLDEASRRASVRRFVEAPMSLPGGRIPPVRAVDMDLAGERVLLTWEVFPQRRFQLVDRARAKAFTVAVDPRREWEEVARLDPRRDDAMLVARMLGDVLRIERASLTRGLAETLCAHRGTTAQRLERFDLVSCGGALVSLEDFPGSATWFHVDASVFGE